MLCPVCKTTHLAIADRQGIEIDYCPDCRGIRLDRGELEKLIDKMGAQQSAPAYQQPIQQAPVHHQSSHSHHQGYPHQQGQHQHKRESWIGELFDFG